MAKKRVHEIAKAQGLTSKELLAALKKAGVEAKAAQSSVEESDALAALKGSGDGAGGGTATKAAPKKAVPKKAEPKQGSAKKEAAAAKPKAEKAETKASDGDRAAPAP